MVAFTDKRDGDFHLDGDPAGRDARARKVADFPWSWVRQVHGTRVVTVTEAGGGAGEDGDGLITFQAGAVLSVRGADCPVVAFVAPQEAIVGVAHAGWRGLCAGVLEATVGALRANGASHIEAFLGPCISAAHYAFGPQDLATLVGEFGPSVVAQTATGEPALDLVAGVTVALAAAGVAVDCSHHRCTAADTLLYSHRARRETGRHAAAVWIEP